MKRIYLILILLLSLAFIGFAQDGRSTPVTKSPDRQSLQPNGYRYSKCSSDIYCIPITGYNSGVILCIL
ncbi:MAG: hypothetical protein AB7S48_17370 [Bacteroidales bacterium]